MQTAERLADAERSLGVGGSSMWHLTRTVAARSSLMLTHRLPRGMRISVSFRTESNDIAFGAFSRLDGATTELRATARVDAHVLPQFFETAQQERDVTVALLFDNSYSYLTAKTLRVTVCVETAPPAGEHAGGGFLLTRFGAAKLRRRRAEDDVLEVDLPGGGIGYMHASNCVEVPHGVAGSRFELDAIASVVRLAGGAAAAEAAAAAARDAAALAVYKPEEGATSQAPAPADAPDASGTARSAASAASAAAMDLAGRIASGAASALRTATATASSALAAAHSGPLSTVAAWLDDLPAASGSAIAAPASAIIGTASLRVARRFLLHHGWQTRPAAAALLAAARWRAAARAAGTSVADVSRALAAMPVFCPGRDAQGRLVLAVRMAAPGGAALASAGSAARGPDRLAALVCGLEAVGGLALRQLQPAAAAESRLRGTEFALAAPRGPDAAPADEASSSASAAAAPATSAAAAAPATSAAAAAPATSAAAAAPPAPVLSGGITLVVDFTGASSAELSTSFFQRAAATLLLRYPGAVDQCLLLAAPSAVRALWAAVGSRLPPWVAAGVSMLPPSSTEEGIAALQSRLPPAAMHALLHQYPDCASLGRAAAALQPEGEPPLSAWGVPGEAALVLAAAGRAEEVSRALRVRAEAAAVASDAVGRAVAHSAPAAATAAAAAGKAAASGAEVEGGATAGPGAASRGLRAGNRSSLDGGSGDVDNDDDDDDDVDADLSIVAAAAASAPTGPGVARPGHLSRVSDAPPPADSPASDAVEVVQWGSLSSDDAPAAAARGGELLAQAMDEPAPLADALGDDEVSV